MGCPDVSDSKASARNVGHLGSIPRLGRSPREENGNPLQYSCLENFMDGGAWWATVHGVSKSRTGLSDFTFSFTFHLLTLQLVAPPTIPDRNLCYRVQARSAHHTTSQ